MISTDKQYGVGHKIQRLYVHWDVSTQCNFDCSYCYAKKQYGTRWGNIDSWEKQLKVLASIKISTLPVFLGLLGGEPTIHPKFLELYEKAFEAISTHKDGRLYITTNGSKSTDFFRKVPYHKNIYFLWSFHSEFLKKYSTPNSKYGKLIDNITLMQERGFKNKVNVLLSTDKKYWKIIKEFSHDVQKIDGVELHPHFIYDGSMDSTLLHSYSEEFYEYFKEFMDYKKEFVIEKNGVKKEYNDYEMFSQGLNKFKSWNCWNNNYEINYDGKVMKFCFKEYDDLNTNIMFFRNIKKIVPEQCPFEVCNCDGLLKIHKEST